MTHTPDPFKMPTRLTCFPGILVQDGEPAPSYAALMAFYGVDVLAAAPPPPPASNVVAFRPRRPTPGRPALTDTPRASVMIGGQWTTQPPPPAPPAPAVPPEKPVGWGGTRSNGWDARRLSSMSALDAARREREGRGGRS